MRSAARLTRSSLALLAGPALLASVAGAPVRADDTDGVYLLASEQATQAPRALPAHRGDRTSFVVPGARLTPTEVSVAARDNGNTAFYVDVRYPHRGGGDCERGLLRLGTSTFVTESWGGDSDSCSLDFELDPASAQRAAAFFHVTRQDRHPVAEHVTGVFSTARRRYHVGEPVEVVLTMTSPVGAPAVAWEHGGRNRGPRDDQFSFTVTRDGQPVAPIDAMNFGGLSFMDGLAGGEHDEVSTPLAPWADLSHPGHYVVTCRFETVFAPAGVAPYDAGTRGQAWDRAFTGTVSFDVVR